MLVTLLVRTGIIHAPVSATGGDHPGQWFYSFLLLVPQKSGSPSFSRLAELARARAAHSAIADELRTTRQRLDETNKGLEKDWGPDWEWKKLDGTCIEKDLGEYVRTGRGERSQH